MKQFFMELKNISSDSKDKMVIKDRRGEEIYTVILGKKPEEELLFISGNTKKSVVLVKQSRRKNYSQFAVLLDEKELFLIETDEQRTVLTADSDDLTIDGSLLDMKFDVMFGYRKVGKIRQRWVSSEDAYELTVFEDDRELALIGLLAVLNLTINMKNVA